MGIKAPYPPKGAYEVLFEDLARSALGAGVAGFRVIRVSIEA